MREMIGRIRWRLVAWTMLVLSLILVFLGTVVYIALDRALLAAVDRSLTTHADQASDNLAAMARGERREDREGYRGGVFYIALGSDGRVIANPQRVDVAELDQTMFTVQHAPFATVTLNGEAARVHARPLRGRVPPGSWLLVGQSLAPQQSALRSLLLVLAGGGGMGLLLSLGGGWFLAGRALVPIQTAFTRQQEFVADASHELRTPLTVLRSATDVLDHHRDVPLSANGELFDDVRYEIARMERLANDLLTLARSDRGEFELAVAPVDLGALASDVVRRMGPLAQARDIALRCRTGTSAPVEGTGRQTKAPTDPTPETTVEGDPDRIEQVLFILLDNALRHTPAGGRVDVAVDRDERYARVEVHDTGTGIAPEHLPRVFDRFFRVDSARSRAAAEHRRTGLGLAIAKLLVEAHGGDVSLTSTLGAGTSATVRIPLSPDARSGREAPNWQAWPRMFQRSRLRHG